MRRGAATGTRRSARAAGAVLIALLSTVAVSCSDEREAPLSPSEGARLESSGTYPPIVDPSVRTTPFLVHKEGHLVWFQLTNTASMSRSYWFGAGVGGGVLQLVKTPEPVTVPAGASRWIPVEIAVNSDAADGAQGVVYFSARDSQGDSYGLASTSLAVEVNTSRPAVGFVSPQDYRARANGQTHREAPAGGFQNLRLWVKNQAGTTETICARWLTDEGYYGQTEMPYGNTCLVLPAHHAGEMNFAYRMKATATPGVTDRQTVVVYTTSSPNALTYGYLRSTTASGAAQSFQRFFGWTMNTTSHGNRHGIPVQILKMYGPQEREYAPLDWDVYNPGTNDPTAYAPHAAANPGKVWIYGDEPDMNNRTPAEYADLYRGFVNEIRKGDPSARFSPAGFAQEYNNELPNIPHGTKYAQEFVDAYRSKYFEDPPVAEWRFHAMNMGNLTWETEVKKVVEWGQSRGAPVVVGSVQNVDMAFVMGRVNDQSWLAGASGWITSMGWWTYDHNYNANLLVVNDALTHAYGCPFVYYSQGGKKGEGCP